MTANRNVLIDTILKLHVGTILVFIFAPILGSFVFSLNSDRFPSLPLGHFSTEWYRLIWEDPAFWQVTETKPDFQSLAPEFRS